MDAATDHDSNEMSETEMAQPSPMITRGDYSNHGNFSKENDNETRGESGGPDQTDENPASTQENIGTTFRSSAQDAVAKAISLAKTKTSKTGSDESEPAEISIEDLRDIINQNPEEFWKSRTVGSKDNISPSINPEPSLVFFQNTETNSTRKKKDYEGIETNHPAKRRKVPYNENVPMKPNNTEGPSFEDIETLRAVRILLEESLHKIPSNSDFATGLLEQLTPTESEDTMETDNDFQTLAQKITRAFAQDLSEILRTLSRATETEPTAPHHQNLAPSHTAMEVSLLCDEKDIPQLQDSDERVMDKEEDDDDDIVEISQDENYVQQHLICYETEEGLFGKPAPKEPSTDFLIAQRLALLRATNRLIRAKTLVLTKRRLAIQEEDDISIVI